MARRENGDGTIYYRRSDKRWATQVFVTLANDSRKRVCFSNRNREVVKAKLDEILAQEKKKIPFAKRRWTVSEFIDYWMENKVISSMRPLTIKDYESICRLYIKPQLGKKKINELNVENVQQAIDELKKRGVTNRTLQKFKRTLSSMLQYAMRKELIFRNVARLVETPEYTRKKISILRSEQISLFLNANKDHQWYLAFLFLLNYGMRIGEVLGLRWTDIDFANDECHVRQQLQRIDGKITACDIKTDAGNRMIPLSPLIKKALLEKAVLAGINLYGCFQPEQGFNTEHLLVTNKYGGAVDYHSFRRIYYKLQEQIGMQKSKPHIARHTTATLMKNLHVPDRDIQAILGHANVLTTQQIYQQGDKEVQYNAVAAVAEKIYEEDKKHENTARSRCCQSLLSNAKNSVLARNLTVVAPPRLELGTQGSSGIDIGTYDDTIANKDNQYIQRLVGADSLLFGVLRFFSGSELKHVQKSTIIRALGCAAVKSCCQNTDEVKMVQHNLEICIVLINTCEKLCSERERSFWERF